jgi:hypothetical protein
MGDIYNWLEKTDCPMDGIFPDDPSDPVLPLNVGADGNMYFDMPDAWGTFKQPQVEPLPIDPSLYSMTTPATSGQAIVTVPKHLAEASSKLPCSSCRNPGRHRRHG